jgi:hypothetical protein
MIMSSDANNVMKKLLQRISNHVLNLNEFNDIEKIDIFFAFSSKHKTAMCDWVYGMKIKTDLDNSKRNLKIRDLQQAIKKRTDHMFQQIVCCTDVIFE